MAQAASDIRIESILVPVDFSPGSQQARDMAVGLAHPFGASLRLLHVVEQPQQPHEVYVSGGAYAAPWLSTDYPAAGVSGPTEQAEQERDAMRRAIEHRLEAMAQGCGVTCTPAVRFGHPVSQILGEIEAYHPSLVVMCTHGWTGLRHVLLGSVTERIVRGSPVPVLTARLRDGK